MSCNFLQFVVLFVALATILSQSSERELRPSEHGLGYQEGASPPETDDGKRMHAFFGSTPSDQVQLPEARNVSETWWKTRASKSRARDLGKDHVRLGLLVASAVCGLIGVVLLVVSVVVLLRRRLERQQPPRPRKDERYPSTSAPAPVQHQQYSG